MIVRYKKIKKKKKNEMKIKSDYDSTKIYHILGLCRRGYKKHYFFNILKKQPQISTRIIASSFFKQHVSAQNDLTVIFNFIKNNDKIVKQYKNTIFTEVGFFPHYQSFFFDPLGFCWKSSLTKMKFKQCSDRQRKIAKKTIKQFRIFADKLPTAVTPPFFLWADQLLRDNTNAYGLKLGKWSILIKHFRQCLPDNIQLVIKTHPRSRHEEHSYLYELPKILKNTTVVKKVDLKSLLTHCVGVTGANSTVLYEGRLIYNKPTYAYAKSWFSNHEELFYFMDHTKNPKPIKIFNSKAINKDYLYWFLYQIIIRQILISDCKEEKMLKKMLFLCKDNFDKYGEEIFK